MQVTKADLAKWKVDVGVTPSLLRAKTNEEAMAMFIPEPSLVAAVNDAKVLYMAARTSRPTTLKKNTWFLVGVQAGDPSTTACKFTMVIVNARGESRNICLHAQTDGQWVKEGRKYTSLLEVLDEVLETGIQEGICQPLPAVTFFEWVRDPDVHEVDRALQRRNHALFTKLTSKALAEYWAEPAPYPQPHFVHAYMHHVTGGVRTPFLVGYHADTQSWFVLDPRGDWSRVSVSLGVLLATLPITGDDLGLDHDAWPSGPTSIPDATHTSTHRSGSPWPHKAPSSNKQVGRSTGYGSGSGSDSGSDSESVADTKAEERRYGSSSRRPQVRFQGARDDDDDDDDDDDGSDDEI
jgi:hypothetical protein